MEGCPPQISLYLGSAMLANANTESRIAMVSAVLKYFSFLPITGILADKNMFSCF